MIHFKGMKIALACDHAGFELKGLVSARLLRKHYRVIDAGPFSEGRCDYPDFAKKAAKLVSSKKAERAILICGSGIGMAMAANKIKGVRAAACESVYTAKMSRLHNDSNILCLGSRVLSKQKALKLIDIWLKTGFEGGRHIKRVKKIG